MNLQTVYVKLIKILYMNFPDSLYYSKEHTWLKLNGDQGIIGITEFAQSELGEMVYVDLPRVGQIFTVDTIFGSVEAVKTTSDLFMPVSGEITEINSALLREPTLLNTDPFSSGWIIKIKLTSQGEQQNLLGADQYKETIGQ